MYEQMTAMQLSGLYIIRIHWTYFLEIIFVLYELKRFFYESRHDMLCVKESKKLMKKNRRNNWSGLSRMILHILVRCTFLKYLYISSTFLSLTFPVINCFNTSVDNFLYIYNKLVKLIIKLNCRSYTCFNPVKMLYNLSEWARDDMFKHMDWMPSK